MKSRQSPKPTALKVLQGTNRPDRGVENEPVPSSDAPIAPNWLNHRAREIFEDRVLILDELQLASASHVDMLAMLASRLEEVERFSKYLDDVGSSYKTTTKDGRTMWRSYPEVAQRNEAFRHGQSLLAEFGLSPASGAKVNVPTQTQDNPWASLVN